MVRRVIVAHVIASSILVSQPFLFYEKDNIFVVLLFYLIINIFRVLKDYFAYARNE